MEKISCSDKIFAVIHKDWLDKGETINIPGFEFIEDSEKERDEKRHESFAWTRILKQGDQYYKYDLMYTKCLSEVDILDLFLTPVIQSTETETKKVYKVVG